MKIYQDTPKHIINMLLMCDYHAIQAEKFEPLLSDLKNLITNGTVKGLKISSFIPVRTEINAPMLDIDLPGCPPKLIELINYFHWAKISWVTQSIASPFILNWFKANLPQKRLNDRTDNYSRRR